MWPLIAAVMAAFAEMDNMLRAEMVRRGQRHAFERGLNIGNYPRHLYRLLPDDPSNPDRTNQYTPFRSLFPTWCKSFSSSWQRCRRRMCCTHNEAPPSVGRTVWDVDDLARMIKNPRLKGAVRTETRHAF